jgi:hypothetical protein
LHQHTTAYGKLATLGVKRESENCMDNIPIKEQWCEPQSDTIGRVQPLLLTIPRFRARIGPQLPTRRHNFDAGQRLDAGEIRHAGHEVDIVIGPRRGFRQQATEH